MDDHASLVPDFMEGCENLWNKTSKRFSNKEIREHTQQEMRRYFFVQDVKVQNKTVPAMLLR